MKPLLVGEDNPYGSDPRYALWCEPRHSAGGRLCYDVLGLSRLEYARRFDRVNLCSGKWSMREARESVARIYRERSAGAMVLLGAKVCRAFNNRKFAPFTLQLVGLRALVILPHPSGRCRIWNDPDAVERARRVLILAGIDLSPSARQRENLPGTDWSTERPALCSNCGDVVEGARCGACGAP